VGISSTWAGETHAGFPAGAGIAPADEQGTNNRTFLVRHGQQRYVPRVSGFLSLAEVRAEHLILLRLRQGGLPFQVPEPVTAPDGQTVIATPAGPAAVCRWLPGVRLGMDGEAAFERFGRTTGLLGAALEATRLWLASNEDAFLSVATAANAGS
jgi:Ser/Thr protein kinase RdoA (MazF antagonist)